MSVKCNCKMSGVLTNFIVSSLIWFAGLFFTGHTGYSSLINPALFFSHLQSLCPLCLQMADNLAIEIRESGSP